MPLVVTPDPNQEQDVQVVLAPVTPKGKPGTVDGAPVYTVESGDVTVEPATDGLSAKIVTATLGPWIVKVEADVDMGAGVTPLIDTISGTTVAVQTAALGLSATLVDKP